MITLLIFLSLLTTLRVDSSPTLEQPSAHAASPVQQGLSGIPQPFSSVSVKPDTPFEDEDLCKICFESNRIDKAFFICSHKEFCESCIVQYGNSNIKKNDDQIDCPICREPALPSTIEFCKTKSLTTQEYQLGCTLIKEKNAMLFAKFIHNLDIDASSYNSYLNLAIEEAFLPVIDALLLFSPIKDNTHLIIVLRNLIYHKLFNSMRRLLRFTTPNAEVYNHVHMECISNNLRVCSSVFLAYFAYKPEAVINIGNSFILSFDHAMINDQIDAFLALNIPEAYILNALSISQYDPTILSKLLGYIKLKGYLVPKTLLREVFSAQVIALQYDNVELILDLEQLSPNDIRNQIDNIKSYMYIVIFRNTLFRKVVRLLENRLKARISSL